MSFSFSERPYSGKSFRPRPEIHLDPSSGLLIVVTPWGSRASARKVIERMKDYIALARGDREATTPFARQSCLSSQANNLRVAALLANEALFRSENLEEYHSGVEVFAGILEGDEFSWLQAGNPQIFLGRQDRSLQPLGSQIDLAGDLSIGDEILPPLPSQLLGIDSTINFNINSFRARPGDQLVLVSHSHPPAQLYLASGQDRSIDSLSRSLALSQPDLAFWIGILQIEDAGAEMSA